MAHYVNTNGVTYAITDHQGFLGVRDGYRVSITDPTGARIYAGVIHPAIFGGQCNGNVLLGGEQGLPRVVPAPAGGTYIVPPGVYASFGIGPATGHVPCGSTFYIGGNALLGVALGVPAGLCVHVAGGCALFGATEAGATLDGAVLRITHGGIFSCGAGLPDVLCGATVQFGAGGGTLVVNAAHMPFDLSGTVILDYNPARSMIEVRNICQPIATYHVTGAGACRTLVLRGRDQTEVGRFTVELANGVVLEEGNYPAAGGANAFRMGCVKTQTRTRACLIEGTELHSAGKTVALETLQTGGLVDVWTQGGARVQRLMWVERGHRHARPELPVEEAGYPIRVLRHALGANMPEHDLLLTPDHSVLHNGQFVPVRMLVNESSIFYDQSITSYQYIMLQTESHAVLVASGVPVEFYLAQQPGQHPAWQGEVVRLGSAAAHTWEKEVLPLRLSGHKALAEVFAQLRARSQTIPGCRMAAEAPELSMDPDLFLLTDAGQRIRLLRRDGESYCFMLPAGVKKVFLTSRTSQPAVVIGPYTDDRRTLGVAVGAITLFSGGRHVVQTGHLRAEGTTWSGWHKANADGTLRWTTGAAELPLVGVREGQMGLLSIQVHAAGPFVVEQPPEAQMAQLRA